MIAHLPQHAGPGERWAYNNAGFGLAGRLIEVVTGRTFEAAMRELVLEPLGMGRSVFSAAEAITHRVAIGHGVRDGRAEVVRRWALPRVLNPAGGLICPANDLLRYARFQLGDGRLADGGRLLSPASMALMRTPRVADALHNGCAASFADEVGLSWFGRATGRGRLLVHGGMSSLALRLTLVPERRFAVFVLTNADLGAQLHAEITKQALRDGAGIDGLDATPLPAPPADPAPDAGTYRLAGPDDEDVAVRRGGDRLTLSEWGEAGFDAPGSDRRARGPLAARARQFLRGAEGRIGYLRIGGRLWRRVS